MHILILPSWYPMNLNDIGGSFFREQALALKKNGCKVGVIALELKSFRNARSVFVNRNIIYEDDMGVATYRKQGLKWFFNISKLLAWLWQKHIMSLFKLYVKKHGKPDIIHVHSTLYAGWAAKVIADKYKIPYVITEHSSAFARNLITPEQKKIIELALISANKRIAVSRTFAHFLTKYFEPKIFHWESIPNIVHESFFSVKIDAREKNKPFTFICVALLNPNKGIDCLIDAFAKVASSQVNVKLKIGGDGSQRLELEMRANQLGVADKIEFLGMLNRRQVVEQVSTADAFVLSSQYETFGVVIVEALALGKPVVATRCGGPEDIVRNEDGILVPVNDSNALASALVRLYNERLSYKSDEIRTSCYERFSEQVIAKKLMQLYINVLVK